LQGGSQDNDFPFTVVKTRRRYLDMLIDFPRLLYMNEGVQGCFYQGSFRTNLTP
jgi:hypothetical protein